MIKINLIFSFQLTYVVVKKMRENKNKQQNLIFSLQVSWYVFLAIIVKYFDAWRTSQTN